MLKNRLRAFLARPGRPTWDLADMEREYVAKRGRDSLKALYHRESANDTESCLQALEAIRDGKIIAPPGKVETTAPQLFTSEKLNSPAPIAAIPTHDTVSRRAYDELANENLTLKQAISAKDAKIASLQIDATKANLLAADAVAQVDKRAAIRAIEVMAAAGGGPVISRVSEKPGQQHKDETLTGIDRARAAIRKQTAQAQK